MVDDIKLTYEQKWNLLTRGIKDLYDLSANNSTSEYGNGKANAYSSILDFISKIEDDDKDSGRYIISVPGLNNTLTNDLKETVDAYKDFLKDNNLPITELKIYDKLRKIFIGVNEIEAAKDIWELTKKSPVWGNTIMDIIGKDRYDDITVLQSIDIN